MTWYAKPTGYYLMGSTEADSNAIESMHILRGVYNWTFEACCGLFGNIDYEGQWNPWRWQADNILTENQARTATGSYAMAHGYGLIGWTPAKKYQFNNASEDGTVFFPNYDQESYPGYGPNFADRSGLATDGAAQIKLIGEAMYHGSSSIWIQRKNMTARNFTQLTDPREAAYYWLWNAEFPADIQSQVNRRMRAAQNWYEHLGGSYSNIPYIVLMKKAIDHSKGLL